MWSMFRAISLECVNFELELDNDLPSGTLLNIDLVPTEQLSLEKSKKKQNFQIWNDTNNAIDENRYDHLTNAHCSTDLSQSSEMVSSQLQRNSGYQVLAKKHVQHLQVTKWFQSGGRFLSVILKAIPSIKQRYNVTITTEKIGGGHRIVYVHGATESVQKAEEALKYAVSSGNRGLHNY